LIVTASFRGRGEDSHQVAVPVRKHASGHRDADANLPTFVQHLGRGAREACSRVIKFQEVLFQREATLLQAIT
jgi:hypothetical protein